MWRRFLCANAGGGERQTLGVEKRNSFFKETNPIMFNLGRFSHSTIARRALGTKVFPSAAAAVADIKSGSKLLVGGFGICGIPEFLIKALRDAGPKYVMQAEYFLVYYFLSPIDIYC